MLKISLLLLLLITATFTLAAVPNSSTCEHQTYCHFNCASELRHNFKYDCYQNPKTTSLIASRDLCKANAGYHCRGEGVCSASPAGSHCRVQQPPEY